MIGIDLSGPRNVAHTALTLFREQDEHLLFLQALHGADDRTFYSLVSDAGKSGRMAIGIDAPLSYNPGGGDRPSDTELRRELRGKGRVGVMTPTRTRMAYLTMRGVALTRALETLRPQLELHILEVHPGAAMLLRGAAAADVAAFKHDETARSHLLDWLEIMRLKDVPRDQVTDHFVAACAAALAAWQWKAGKPAWCHPAQPPEHPYDFAC